MKLSTDVLVVGGGPAGIAAAIAAKREGARVLLVERYGFFGGTATAGLYGALCGFFTSGENQEQVVQGIAAETVELLKKKDAVVGPLKSGHLVVLLYDLPTLKLVLDDMIINLGIDVLLHSFAFQVTHSEDKVSSVNVIGKSGLIEITAAFVIDATGDGDIAALSGSPYEKDENSLQPGSTMFKMDNVDIGELLPVVMSGQYRRILEEAEKSGQYELPRVDGNIIPQVKQGQVIVSLSRVQFDGTSTSSLTAAELKGRAQVRECARFLTEQVPGFKDAYISEIAAQIGVRESRRIEGEYCLTLEDVMTGARFEDSIGRCAWPVEKHIPGTKHTEVKALEGDSYYNLPFRSLIPKGFSNLLVAGRCSSAAAEAQASSRVFAPSMAQGEACGIAASICLSEGVSTKELAVKTLQSKLVEGGALI